MATYSNATNVTEKSTANTVDTITLTNYTGAVEVLNVDGKDNITFTVDGSVPTVLGQGPMKIVPASIGAALSVSCGRVSGNTVVNIITATAVTYSVGIPQ